MASPSTGFGSSPSGGGVGLGDTLAGACVGSSQSLRSSPIRQGRSMPDLGSSVLGGINTDASCQQRIEPSATVLDRTQIYARAAACLANESQLAQEPVVKQEAVENNNWHDMPNIIDLTNDDESVPAPIVIRDDEDEPRPTQADKLPVPRKRPIEDVEGGSDDASSEENPDAPRPTQKRQKPKAPAKKRPARQRIARQKGSWGRKVAFGAASTVENVLGSSLFTDITLLEDVPDLPNIDAQALKRGNSKQLFATIGPDVDPDKAQADARSLNRACNVFGPGIINQDENGQYVIKGMRSHLRPHQVLGTSFLIIREKEARENKDGPRGGILADQMGLGKTVMSLALIVRGKWRDSDKDANNNGGRTTLVVATPGLVLQWQNEIETHAIIGDARRGIGSYGVYRSRNYEDSKKNVIRELSKHDILLTTYDEVAKSFPLKEPPPELTDPGIRQAWWEEHFEKHKGVLHKMNFKRIMLDEGHLIRNPETRKSRACRTLMSKYRWTLTGTPMTNSSADLYCLLDFMKLPSLEDYDTFKERYFRRPTESTMKDLNGVLAKYMLRRSHADRLFGARIVTLPQAKQVQFTVHFNPVEKEIYDIIKEAFAKRLNTYMKSSDMIHRNNSYFAMLTRLRQLTAHPLLIQSTMLDLLGNRDLRRIEDAVDKYGMTNNKDDAKGLMLRIKKLLKTAFKEKRKSRKNGTNANADAPPVATVTTSADQDTGDRYGLNFRFEKFLGRLKSQMKQLDERAIKKCEFCKRKATDPHVTSCMHVYCASCLDDMAHDAAADGLEHATCRNKKCQAVYDYTEPCDETITRVLAMKGTVRKTIGGKQKKKDLPDMITNWLQDGGDMPASAKTLAVKLQVNTWLNDYPDSKIIIYTLWTSMISILENMCAIEDWNCCKYYGGMSHEARSRTLERFETEPDLRIMICSLKCGGLGLNLTMASKVICIDPWWNNAVEEQAFARCFRINQTQETHLLQIMVANSIDEDMNDIKERKQSNIDAFSNESCLKELSLRERLGLFGDVVEDAEGNLRIDISDDEDEDGDDDGLEEGDDVVEDL
ncbi:hypothetical protein CAC42_6165 [Sphaceloma murrayae]|uniref:DNA repair protein RAD5 n=1 Tax=Sphaceloma murrayae TaxID=2082308 RepID=A0A2K1QTF4_9PEZI|nr:hypothetical protein CAC42_6165 [Sphaceloma murrayae]